MRHAPRPPRKLTGFTLMELLVVMMIIGILLSFILAAATNAVRAAEERATQALIAKLDTGLADRIQALLNQRIVPVKAHVDNAYVYALGRDYTASGFTMSNDRDAYQRAGVLAEYDHLKNEIPDVFVVQGTASPNYPLNYAMIPYGNSPGAGPGNANYLDFQAVSPIGSGVSPTLGVIAAYAGTGVWGAAYSVQSGINKNLGKYTDPTTGQTGTGFIAKGYNGVDDNGNTLIDELGESGGDSSIATALANHKHVTSRAEVLYAFLVEGSGPYGSVFNRDDFTAKEVRDTDQDGLPEFVDGWGNPLQFYRWPIFYHSDVQRGLQIVQTSTLDHKGNAICTFAAPYPTGAFATREQDPLDPNQELVMPDWWSAQSNANSPLYANIGPQGGGATFFQIYFHQLMEPLASNPPNGLGSGATNSQFFWDRSNPSTSSVPLWQRRAYYSRPLILSGGPDGQPGVAYLTDVRYQSGTPLFTDAALKAQAASNTTTAVSFLQLENQAAQATLNRTGDGYNMPVLKIGQTDGDFYTNQLQVDGLDDISNHNLNSSGAPVQ